MIVKTVMKRITWKEVLRAEGSKRGRGALDLGRWWVMEGSLMR